MKYDFDVLFTSLAAAPNQMRELLADVPVDAFTFKPSDDQFSILENVCHLRDIELEGYSTRIKRILNEDEPELPDIDGGRLAIERNYNRQDLASAADAFISTRKANLELIRGIDERQLSRVGKLQGVGSVTLEELLEMMTEHDEGHFEELHLLRRLVTTRSQN